MLFKRLCNYDIQTRGGGEGFIPVGVDTLGPVVREYLKSIVRNVIQRAWWVLMRLCTNSGAVYMRSSFDDVVTAVTGNGCTQNRAVRPRTLLRLSTSAETP